MFIDKSPLQFINSYSNIFNPKYTPHAEGDIDCPSQLTNYKIIKQDGNETFYDPVFECVGFHQLAITPIFNKERYDAAQKKDPKLDYAVPTNLAVTPSDKVIFDNPILDKDLVSYDLTKEVIQDPKLVNPKGQVANDPIALDPTPINIDPTPISVDVPVDSDPIFQDGKTYQYTYIADLDNDHYIKFGDNSLILQQQVISPSLQIGVLNNITSENPSNSTHLTITSNLAPYDSLLGYWSFDSDFINTTAVDFSSNNFDGTYKGAIINQTGCIYNDCAQFIPSSTIQIPNTANVPNPFNFTNASTFSISAWVLDVDALGLPGLGIIQKGDRDAAATYGLYTQTSGGVGGKIEFIIKSNSGIGTAVSSNSALNDSKWHYIVGTFNVSGGMSIYVDSILQTTTNSTRPNDFFNTTLGASGNLNFGTGNFNAGRQFNGSLDEIMIFNTSLTQQQISDIYNNRSQRFFVNGNQQNQFFNISLVNNTQLNLSLINYERNFGSNLTIRMLTWNVSLGYNVSDLNTSLNGLVSYWNFDNNSALGEGLTANSTLTVDREGRNNLSAGQAAPNNPALVQGIWGNARQYNGTLNNAFQLNSSVGNLILTPGSNFTLSYWIYSLTGNSGSKTHIGYALNGGNVGFATQGNADNTFICVIGNGTVSNGTGGFGIAAPLGRWNHIVCTWDSTNITLYINNIKQASARTTITGRLPNNASGGAFSIGGSTGAQSINASIDEVMIFNRSITDTERTELFNKGRALYNASLYQNVTDVLTTYNYSADCGASNLIGAWINSQNGTCFGFNGTSSLGAGWNGSDRGTVGNLTAIYSGNVGNRFDLNRLAPFNFTNTTQFSIGLWFKTTKGNGVMLGTGGISTKGYSLSVGSDRAVNWLITGNTSSQTATTSIKVYTDNNWHHAVGTYDSNQTITLYVDGQFAQSISTKVGDFSPTTNNFTIGTFLSDFNRQFQGSLDEVFVYNRSLNASEILNIYMQSAQIHSNNLFSNISNSTTHFIIDTKQRQTGVFVTPNVSNSTALLETLGTADVASFINLPDVTMGCNLTSTFVVSVGSMDVILNGVNIGTINTGSVSPKTFTGLTCLTGLNNITYHPTVVTTLTVTNTNIDYTANRYFYTPIVYNQFIQTFFTTDILAPIVNLIAPSNGTITDLPVNFFAANISDESNLFNATLFLYNATSGAVVQTNTTSISGLNGLANLSLTILTPGTYLWNYQAYDQAGNQAFNNTNFTFILSADSSNPRVDNLTVVPASPQIYSPFRFYQFNASITDNSGILGTVLLTLDGKNYTPAQSGNVFTVTLFELRTGVLTGRWFANDTMGNVNNTQTFPFTVTINTTVLNLLFSPGQSVSSGTTTTVTGQFCPTQLTCNLFRGLSSVVNPDIQILSDGVYPYVFNNTGNQNYTAQSVKANLTVSSSSGGSSSGTTTNVCDGFLYCDPRYPYSV